MTKLVTSEAPTAGMLGYESSHECSGVKKMLPTDDEQLSQLREDTIEKWRRSLRFKHLFLAAG